MPLNYLNTKNVINANTVTVFIENKATHHFN
jgi:hypothetical protein